MENISISYEGDIIKVILPNNKESEKLIKQIRKSLKDQQTSDHRKTKSLQALEDIFSLEGCLKNEKVKSVELQKKSKDLWIRKYDSDNSD